MMKKNPILIYTFSGTGNTAQLVAAFADKLKANGYNAEVRQMTDGFDAQQDSDFTLGLAFPVAIQSTFPLVWDFVNQLPDGKGRDVFMLDSMESYSGGIVGPMKKLLSGKNYNCIGAAEFRMSSSMNRSVSKVESGRKRNARALKAVELYAEKLINCKAEWKRIPLLSDMMRSISAGRKIWTDMSRKISVTEECTLCGICIRNCPVKAITAGKDRVAIDHEKCNVCMRCLAGCPRKAIRLNGKPLILC